MVENSNNAAEGASVHGQVSWVDQITMLSEGGKIVLYRDNTVSFNDTKVSQFPFFASPYFQVEVFAENILLNSDLGENEK